MTLPRARRLTIIEIAGHAGNGYLSTYRADCGCRYVTRDDNVGLGAVVYCSVHP